LGGYLVIDTETTGLFRFNDPAEAEGQPYLASVALLFCDDAFNLEHQWAALIRPDGWTMPDEAIAIHGLTNERLHAEGIDVSVPLAIYSGAIVTGRTIVAFNAWYDTKVMRGALRRARLPDLERDTQMLCVMEAMTGVCCIPSRRGGYKWPRLAEAHVYLFGAEHEGAHGALPDALAALRIAREMRERGYPLPLKAAA
jgi:DNA polymerase III epsilon subunit-like protein